MFTIWPQTGKWREGTFKILVQQVVKGMRGTMPIQYFPGLIIDSE